ncbi:MAG: hypothetical protein ACKOYN_00455 [Planctomycetota bacterium]
MLTGNDEPSRDELLELATLEALGLLDEVGETRLDRAFRAATPAVQDEIRALQMRVAMDPALRSSEEPPASLRLRAIARVVHAIEEDAKAAAPIATIGQPARGAREHALASEIPLDEAIARRVPRQNPGVSGLWRVAALFALAALAVSLYFNAQTTEISRVLVGAMQSQQLDEQARHVVAQLGGAMLSVDQRLQLVAKDGVAGDVRAYVDRAGNRLVVVGLGLDDRLSVLKVRCESEDGSRVELGQVAVRGGFAVSYAIPADFPAQGGRIELIDGDGVTVFFTA